MSHLSNIKKLLSSEQSPAPLYSGTFFFSSAHGGFFTLAQPFIVKLAGGTDKELGIVAGLGTAAYAISCLTAGKYLDKLNPKRTLQLSSGLISIAVAMTFLVIHLHLKESLPVNPITAIIVINILMYLCLAMFWPPMMGWLSTGHEGAALSKRLGIFNLTWSFALVISPLLAGFIIQKDPNLAVLTAAILLALAFISVSNAAPPAKTTNQNKQEVCIQQDVIGTINPINATFRSMARLALFTSCFAVALLRTQFALLFTEDLGFSKSQFGIAITFLCLANFAVFYITSKTAKWHHKLIPFITAQLITAAGIIVILFSTSLLLMFSAATLVGAGQSFVYSSNQFYGVSGKKSRSGSMANHEIIIALGYGSGAYIGGYLSESFTRYTPYKFCFGTIAIMLAIQVAIFAWHKKKTPAETRAF